MPVARLAPYGLVILTGLIVFMPLLEAELGLDLNAASHVLASSADATISDILRVTGNA